MTTYYNELDPVAAQWLRNLMVAGHIAPGDVDERSISDVRATDLAGYTQCHFFAGIGIWSYALRRAGWPDTRPVWTGSCPCQPFSAAGRRGGFDDARHLWPTWFELIEQCRPLAVFGEQVASKDGLAWLDAVLVDLEGQDYACWPVDLSASSVGAPHIRQRLYWVADANDAGLQGWRTLRQRVNQCAIGSGGVVGGMADTQRGGIWSCGPGSTGSAPSSLQGIDEQRQRVRADTGSGDDDVRTRRGPTNGHWRAADWLYCRDDKWRPVEPGTFPLAHGVAGRVGRLRAYGNGLCAETAAEFIGAAMQSIGVTA